jgi:hypothetical protein
MANRLTGEGEQAMKRITTIGLCLIGVLATSAVAAASASAEAPEYGRCVKGVAHEGGFTTATCVATDKEDNDGVYEWLPGAGTKPGFRTEANLTESTGGLTFETVRGTKIACKSESGAGEFVGTKEVRISSIKFKGCQASGAECSTGGAAAEEIVTNELTGNLRFAVGGKTKKKLVNELVPTSGPLLVGFACNTFPVEVRPESTGGLLNNLVSDKMITKSSNKYALLKGEQKPAEYEDLEGKLVSAGLEENFAGGPFEESGMAFTNEQTNEEAIEANAVV